MAITAVDKVRLTKFLNSKSIGDIYYNDMCDALGKRGKIKDIEFLEYFTDSVINEFRKNDKASMKFAAKLISCAEQFLCWMHEEEADINEEILDKIRNFKDFYEEYLERTGNDRNPEFEKDSLNFILDKVNELYPLKDKRESMVKYINRVSELEEEIKKLKKQLVETQKLYDKTQELYQEKSDVVTTLKEEVNPLKEEIKIKNKEISGLNKTIESLKSKIDELELMVANAKAENDSLSECRSKVDELSAELENLQKSIAIMNEEKRKKEDLKARQYELEKAIYMKLLTDNCTIDEILESIKEYGFVSDKKEVADLLRRIRSRINIESNSFSISPKYKVVAPVFLTDGKLSIDIPNGCKSYDIMLVSDFHIKAVDDKLLKEFDVLNNYCAKHGINLILNLGDFYHGYGHLNYHAAVNNYNTVEQSILKIPKACGIYHAILGGNHDKRLIKYGFDPLEFLATEREDFINLGYTHSTISLNNSKSNLVEFDLHHPDSFDFQIDLGEDGLDTTQIRNYLNGIYSAQGRDRGNSYVDIFGHNHKNQFNSLESYCFIPPFIEMKERRGACHLRIFFDEKNNIKYMVFMPLSYNDKLTRNNEIFHQKILKK